MREYWILTKIKLLSLLGLNKARHATDPEEKKKARRSLLILVVMVVALGNVSVTYTLLLLSALPGAELDAITLMSAGLSGFLVLFSTLSVKGLLFAGGDYDTVMSRPIPHLSIVWSRITALYAYNAFYALLFFVPMLVIYAIRCAPGMMFYPAAILLLPIMPALPTCIGIVLGTAATYATSKMKKAALFNTALQMLLALLIMAVSMRLGSSMGSVAPDAAEKAVSIYPPAGLYAGALGGNALSGLLFAAISLAALFVTGQIVAKIFLPLSTRLLSVAQNAPTVRRNRQTTRVRGALSALYRVEWKRYLSSSIYVTNTAFGELMLIVMAVLAVIKRADIAAFLAASEMPILKEMLPLALAMPISMAATTPCAVSMEGRQLWIVKSLPVRARDWLLSKVLVSLTPALPAILLSATAIALALGLEIEAFAMLCLVPAVYAFFMAVFGLMINLAFPKFDWKSEAEAVKQSLAVGIVVMAGMLFAAAPAIIGLATGNADVLPKFTVALFAAAVLLFRLLSNNGEKRMKKLN